MIMEIVLLEIMLLALLNIGVLAAVWELERIRQILNKRPWCRPRGARRGDDHDNKSLLLPRVYLRHWRRKHRGERRWRSIISLLLPPSAPPANA